jgi:hypothetical protein
VNYMVASSIKTYGTPQAVVQKETEPKNTQGDEAIPNGLKQNTEDKVNLSGKAKYAANVVGGLAKGIGLGTVEGTINTMHSPLNKTDSLVAKNSNNLELKNYAVCLGFFGGISKGTVFGIAAAPVVTAAAVPVLGPAAPLAGAAVAVGSSFLGAAAGTGIAGMAIKAAEGAVDGGKKGADFAEKIGNITEEEVSEKYGETAGKAAGIGAATLTGAGTVTLGAARGAVKESLGFAKELSGDSSMSYTMYSTGMIGKLLIGFTSPVAATVALAIPGATAGAKGAAEGFKEGFNYMTEGKPSGEFVQNTKGRLSAFDQKFQDAARNVADKIRK